MRHSSPFDDTNSYFDFTHIFALKTISCDINSESSGFSHFNWTHRFYLTIWNGLLEFKTNYDTRNACHHNYINVIREAEFPLAGNREKKIWQAGWENLKINLCLGTHVNICRHTHICIQTHMCRHTPVIFVNRWTKFSSYLHLFIPAGHKHTLKLSPLQCCRENSHFKATVVLLL